MYKFKKILLLAAVTLSASAYSQEWVKVAESDTNTFHIQAGSSRITNNDDGVKVVAVNGKQTVNATKRIIPVQWYVSVRHCLQKRGKLVVVDTVGKFLSEHDFIFGSGNIASTISEVICRIEFNDEMNQNAPAPSTQPNRNTI